MSKGDKNRTTEDLEDANIIFAKYNSLLDSDIEVSWYQFEQEIRAKFNIGYQTMRNIVLEFYRDNQWTELCIKYTQASKRMRGSMYWMERINEQR